MSSPRSDVADPTDWLNTPLSALSTLDNALRCQVCKEFYDTPMVTSCSHTFCSLCIRRCLSNDGKCPACRSEDQASKLRMNWTVQECVDAFKKARQPALDLAKRPREAENPKRKRRKEDGEDDRDETMSSPPSKRTRSAAKGGVQRQRGAAAADIIIVDSEEGEMDIYVPEPSSEPVEPDDGLVPCPMCSRRMKEEAVFGHLDHCNGELTPAPSLPPKLQPRTASVVLSAAKQPTKQHLPHLNYSLLKDNALKGKLKELGLPNWGSRQLWIRRHTQWVDIYNANLDSLRPRSNRELLKDLDLWERTQGGHAQNQGQPVIANVMRKDFNGSEWTGKHKGQFDDLVAQAKAMRMKKKTDETNTVKDSADRAAKEGRIPADTELAKATNGLGLSPKHGLSLSKQTSRELEMSASPVASILCTAAQEVRRRSISMCGSPTSGVISLTTIPSRHCSGSLSKSESGSNRSPTQSPRCSGTASQHQRATSNAVSDKMAINGAREMPIFEASGDPTNDIDDMAAK